MADKAFPIYFNWNNMMREYLDPASRCVLTDALQDFYENGVDPIPNVPEELRFPLALMIDCINIKRTRSAEMAERGRRGASKRYGADDDDEPKQSDSNAMAQPSQSDNHYNENNNDNENDNTSPNGDGVKRTRTHAKKAFRPPTREEVREYARSRNSICSPDQFYDFFDAGDWIDSKGNPVRAWKQKFVSWEMSEAKRAAEKPKKGFSGPSSFDGNDFFESAVEKAYAVLRADADDQLVRDLKTKMGVTA